MVATLVPVSRQHATTEDTHGLGLLLVEILADRWGAAEVGERKVVWFEVPVRAGSLRT